MGYLVSLKSIGTHLIMCDGYKINYQDNGFINFFIEHKKGKKTEIQSVLRVRYDDVISIKREEG